MYAMLGETFEMILPEKRVRFLIEEVCYSKSHMLAIVFQLILTEAQGRDDSAGIRATARAPPSWS